MIDVFECTCLSCDVTLIPLSNSSFMKFNVEHTDRQHFVSIGVDQITKVVVHG